MGPQGPSSRKVPRPRAVLFAGLLAGLFVALEPVRALAQDAEAPGDALPAGAVATLDVFFESYRAGGCTVFFKDRAGSLSNAVIASARCADVLDVLDKVAQPGDLIRLYLDEDGQVVDVTVKPKIEGGPIGPGDPADAVRRRRLEELSKLEPGARVRVDGVEYDVKEIRGFEIVVEPEDGGDPVAIDVISAKSFEVLDAASSGPADPAFELKTGKLVEIEGRRGFVTAFDAKTVTIRPFEGGELRSFRRPVHIEPIPMPDVVFDPPPGGAGPAPIPGTPERPVVVKVEPGSLDPIRNQWTFAASATHSVPDSLLIEAWLDIEWPNARGIMVDPETERRILRDKKKEIDLKGVTTFRWERETYYARKVGGEYIIAIKQEVGVPTQRQHFKAIFPGLPEAVPWDTNLYEPQQVEVKLRGADPQNFISFKDRRAIGALIQAYDDPNRSQAVRLAALNAMGVNGSRDLLPFLLYHLYFDPEGMAPHLKRAILQFGKAADEYLVDFIKNDGHQKPFRVPGVIAKDAVSEPNVVLALAIDLLASRGPPADAKDAAVANAAVLQYVVSADDRLRYFAQQYFIKNSTATLFFLANKVASGGSNLVLAGAARDMLVQIDVEQPNTLIKLLKEIGRGSASETEWMSRIGGLSEEEQRTQIVDRIRQLMTDAHQFELDPGAYALKIAYERIKEHRAALVDLRREVAEVHVGQTMFPPPPGQDRRRWQMQLLRQGLVLDPTNATARRALAWLLRQIAEELQQGIGLRAGPADEYRLIRLGRPDERLPADTERRPQGDWRPVKLPETGIAWIHRAGVQEGPGAYVVLATPVREPVECMLLYDQAKALEPSLAADIDLAIARNLIVRAQAHSEGGAHDEALDLYRRAAGLGDQTAEARLYVMTVRANPVLAGMAILLAIAIPGSLVMLRRVRQVDDADLAEFYKKRAARATGEDSGRTAAAAVAAVRAASASAGRAASASPRPSPASSSSSSSSSGGDERRRRGATSSDPDLAKKAPAGDDAVTIDEISPFPSGRSRSTDSSKEQKLGLEAPSAPSMGDQPTIEDDWLALEKEMSSRPDSGAEVKGPVGGAGKGGGDTLRTEPMEILSRRPKPPGPGDTQRT